MMSGRTFRHQHRVTYASCTLGNHVYYARYLDILEEARGEFFRSLGMPFLALQNQNVIFPVTGCSFSYKSPARYDDVLTIEISVTQLTKVRLGFNYRILKESDALVLEGQSQHVSCTIDEKPTRMPGELIAKLEGFLTAAVTAGS
jgi:acyl-CoA thioester hydrolase